MTRVHRLTVIVCCVDSITYIRGGERQECRGGRAAVDRRAVTVSAACPVPLPVSLPSPRLAPFLSCARAHTHTHTHKHTHNARAHTYTHTHDTQAGGCMQGAGEEDHRWCERVRRRSFAPPFAATRGVDQGCRGLWPRPASLSTRSTIFLPPLRPLCRAT